MRHSILLIAVLLIASGARAQVLVSAQQMGPHETGGGGEVTTPVLLDAVFAGESDPVTDTIAPSGDALIIALGYGLRNGGTTVSSVSSTFSTTGGWTVYLDQTNFQTGAGTATFFIAWATTTSSPGTGTVAADFSDFVDYSFMHVVEMTGHDTSTPIVQDAYDSSTSPPATLAPSLASAIGAGSMVIGVAFSASDTDGYTPGGTSTEIADIAFSGRRLGSYYAETNSVSASDIEGSQTLHMFAFEVAGE